MLFFVRTKLNNIFRSISFSESELDSFDNNGSKFIDSIIEKGKQLQYFRQFVQTIFVLFALVLIEHGAQSEEFTGFDLVDEYGMSIDDKNVFIVKQFINCSHFFVELRTNPRHNNINVLCEVSD